MTDLLNIVGAVFALIGGITLFRGLFTPKRFTARRPFLFTAGWGTLAVAVLCFVVAGQTGPPTDSVAPPPPEAPASTTVTP